MASAPTDDSLETWLNKATNPLMKEEDWEAIVGFCDQVNKELEGPQTAVRLLIHKIQSPQEKESLLALTTLEACVKNCGRRFQQEIGKFRFINEIIKVVSPKYLGNHMSEKVKQKCIELLYSWSQVLTHEPKIKEAYQMLRRQGIVKQDPVFIDQEPCGIISSPKAGAKTAPRAINQFTHVNTPGPLSLRGHVQASCGTKQVAILTPVHTTTLEAPPPPPERNSIFDDDEKSKLLSRLLRSKNPEDLQAANRLIKNMVKQDAERTEKVSRRVHQLETVSNNVKLLSEMLNNHQPNSSTESDREIMKELYDNLEKQRPNLFRLASDTDENDPTGISDILKANDEVANVMALYSQVINNATVANLLEPGPKTEKPSFLTDLESLSHSASTTSSSSHFKLNTQTSSLLDEQLLSLGLENSGTTNGLGSASSEAYGNHSDELDDIFGPVMSADSISTTSSFSSSLSSDLLSVSRGAQASSGFGAAPAYSVSLSISSSSSPHGTLKTSFPAPAFAGSAGFVVPMSAAGKVDLIPTGHGMKTTLAPVPLMSTIPQSTAAGGGAVHLSKDLSDLFKPASTMSDVSMLFGGGESGVQTTASITKTSAGLDYLNELSRSLLEQSLSNSGLKPYQPAPPVPKIPLNQLTKATSSSSSAPTAASILSSSASIITSVQPSHSPIATPPLSTSGTPSKRTDTTGLTMDGLIVGKDVPEALEVKSLADIFVPLETIQPGSQAPIIAYEKNNLKIVFHFGKDRPRPDVQVVAITTMSTSTSPIKNFNFQAAVPKVMKIQLQPASATDLPVYNPILPPSAITQVMLISHPPHEKIRLKFKITYSINEAITTDVGEVEDIPVE